MAEQEISALTVADQKRLAEQRQVVMQFLRDDDRGKYRTAAGKLGALRALLEAQVFDSSQTYELQSMGIVLGDVFVQDLGLHWIMVEDEYGRDPAIRHAESSIIIFPLTMISKRVERGDKVDVFELYNGVAAQINEITGNDLAR